MFKGLINYFKGTRSELAKVTWPTREETLRLTIVVLILTAIFAAFIGALDLLFTYAVRIILSN